MKELHLKNSDLKAIVDDDDFDHLSKFSWKLCNGYAVSCKKYYKLHNIVYGFNQDLTVDHINNNKLDNRKENLRWATRKQQCAPGHRRPKSTKIIKSQDNTLAL